MKKISFGYTSFHKRFLALLYFGVLTFEVVRGAGRGAFSEGNWALIAVPGLLAVLAFVYIKKCVWSLVDEVHDGGDFLLVRNRGAEERIALSNIVDVSASHLADHPRITLRLARPGRFGAEISFSSRHRLSILPFKKDPIAEDLVSRVNDARISHAGPAP